MYYLFYLLFFKTLNSKIIEFDAANWVSKIQSVHKIQELFRYPEFRELVYYRAKKNSLFIKLLILFSKTIYNSKTLLFIHTKNIGKGFFIEHGFSTIISAISIGDNFHINQNCTIGWTNQGGPIIGDNVSVGCNAVVIGNIIIGNNVTIGAGSIVTKSIPKNCTVVGNPARIINKNGQKVNIPL
jgi:serine O-acetyltransferase